jgi:hypothetical protein
MQDPNEEYQPLTRVEIDERAAKHYRRTYIFYAIIFVTILFIFITTLFSSLLVAYLTSDSTLVQLKFKHGAVATDSPDCSRIGAFILQQGI